jgi:hypothetical protein
MVFLGSWRSNFLYCKIGHCFYCSNFSRVVLIPITVVAIINVNLSKGEICPVPSHYARETYSVLEVKCSML